MPRLPRADHPGALLHVMVRGVEKRSIVLDDEDRYRFLDRLADALRRGGGRCLAWALMSNHFHLLHETGPVPVARVMHALGTAHALDFNRKYRRVGHLFQGRYLAKPVGTGETLLHVVRYVHLNPVKAALVPDVSALGTYPWTGHATLLGNRCTPFQNTESVLAMFPGPTPEARRSLVRWMEVGLSETGACYPGPTEEYRPARASPGGEPPTFESRSDASALAVLLRSTCVSMGVSERDLREGRRERRVSRVRERIALLATDTLALPGEVIATALGISASGLTRCVQRARHRGESQKSGSDP